jgi:hypothetical protein
VLKTFFLVVPTISILFFCCYQPPQQCQIFSHLVLLSFQASCYLSIIVSSHYEKGINNSNKTPINPRTSSSTSTSSPCTNFEIHIYEVHFL